MLRRMSLIFVTTSGYASSNPNLPARTNRICVSGQRRESNNGERCSTLLYLGVFILNYKYVSANSVIIAMDIDTTTRVTIFSKYKRLENVERNGSTVCLITFEEANLYMYQEGTQGWSINTIADFII